jgi:hypothetical protein
MTVTGFELLDPVLQDRDHPSVGVGEALAAIAIRFHPKVKCTKAGEQALEGGRIDSSGERHSLEEVSRVVVANKELTQRGSIWDFLRKDIGPHTVAPGPSARSWATASSEIQIVGSSDMASPLRIAPWFFEPLGSVSDRTAPSRRCY